MFDQKWKEILQDVKDNDGSIYSRSNFSKSNITGIVYGVLVRIANIHALHKTLEEGYCSLLHNTPNPVKSWVNFVPRIQVMQQTMKNP